METVYIILSTIFLFFLSLKLLFGTWRRKLNLPPSPSRPFPITGHLHLLKQPIHRTFLSIYNSLDDAPIFSVRLGTRVVYVITSHTLAEECFTKNDLVLANRPHFIAGKYLAYNNTTMIQAAFGDSWRNLRRIGANEIFSSPRLDNFLSIRRDEIRRLILSLSKNSKQEFVKVEMRPLLMGLTINNIMRMIAGKRFFGDATEDVRHLIADVFAIGGAGNSVDYFPILRWVTNYEKKAKIVGSRLDKLLQSLVDENRAEKVKGNTVINHLLSLQETEPDDITDVTIKGIILTMLLAGTDTSGATLEWALSNLVNHPQVLRKAKAEIDNQVGSDRLIDEQDVANLPYLQNIMQETLRLYTVAPMLLPHLSSDDCKVGGYDVPRGTIVFVNAWAIHRDPKIWEEAEKFKPERFEKEGVDKMFMPFGKGRRACPGAPLAQRLVTLALGSLIQCFDWERVGEEYVDMRESDKGITINKATPLLAKCRARSIVQKIEAASSP